MRKIMIMLFMILLAYSVSAFPLISNPQILYASTYPEKVEPGNLMEISAEIKGTVLKVHAQVQHEKGFDTITLREIEGKYRATWVVHDTLVKNYSIIITAEDVFGRNVNAKITYEDPQGDADSVDGMHWWHGGLTSSSSIKAYIDEKAAAVSGGPSGSIGAIAKLGFDMRETDVCWGFGTDTRRILHYVLGTTYVEFDPYNIASLVEVSDNDNYETRVDGVCQNDPSLYAVGPSVGCAAGYSPVKFEESYTGNEGNNDAQLCGSLASGDNIYCITYYCIKN